MTKHTMSERREQAGGSDTPGTIAPPDDATAEAIAVVVPVAERPRPLDEIYREYESAVRAMERPFEFIFVVEPWGRDLVEKLEPLMREGHPIRVLEMGQVVSEAGLLRAAMEHVQAPLVLTLPPYHRVRPEALSRLVQCVEEGVDFASARRDRSSDSWISRVQSRAFHALLRWGTGVRFTDIASGVRVLRRTVLEQVPLYGDFLRFLPILAQQEGFRVEEVSAPQHPDDVGQKIYSPGTYLRRLIDLLAVVFLTRFTQKPLRFFGLIGSGFLLSGGAILFVLFIQRLGGQALADRPMLLLGVLLTVLGFQTLALGLIGEVIVHLHASRHRMYRKTDGTGPS